MGNIRRENMEDLSVWFSREVLRWRTGASVAWTLWLTAPTVFIAASVANIDIFHPGMWIYGCLSQLFSVWSWVSVALICSAFGVLATFKVDHYSVVPTIACTRLESIAGLLHPRRCSLVVLHAVLCGFAAVCYTGVLGGRYKGFTTPCLISDNETCNGGTRVLNEYHLFLVLHGAFTGILSAMHFITGQQYWLVFPIVQQSKFFQVKTGLLPVLLNSAGASLRRLKYFYILYYVVLGQCVKNLALHHVGLCERTRESSLTSLHGLLDVSLLWHTWMSGILISFLLHLMTLLYKVYHTEPFVFPVETVLEGYKNKCLHNALACSTHPIIQYLGYQDLSLLSKHSKLRRQEMFSLTQLGGHPHNWNSIYAECLTSLKDFTHQVAEFHANILTGAPTRQLSGDKSSRTLQKGAMVQGNGTLAHGSLENLSTSDVKFRGSTPTNAQPSDKTAVPSTSEAGKHVMKKRGIASRFLDMLKKESVFAYFLGTLPDASSRQLFANTAKHLWAVEGLSHLVVASFTEDTYGVVQKTLPEILVTLLEVQEGVEKHFKLATNIHRKSPSDSAVSSHLNDAALRYALRAALKAAIYRMVTTFGNHLKSVPMSMEHSKRLAMFLEYKE